MNGLLGFGLMQLNLFEREGPAHFGVTFDSGADSFRKELYEDYKGNRPRLPEGFAQQLEWVKELSGLLGFEVIDTPKHFEADDVLGSLAVKSSTAGIRCLILTSDRDLLQVVNDPLVAVLLSRRGVSKYEILDSAGVMTLEGVSPTQIATLKALIGDKSDNIPGVPGIGPVAARKLIAELGSIDAIVHSAPPIGGKWAALVRAQTNLVYRNLKLTTLALNLDVPPPRTRIDIGKWSSNGLERFLLGHRLASVWRKAEALVAATRATPGLFDAG